ncbi:hypothetical protein TSAR_005546 [Trichomalopsis sarcophagae]|uniref:Uncharacterized protein n=1 Tax=Trichomalopsis sarcophagae TaxID=543379 RepID=A0A232FHQ9_9HYME|nr:hypothetical protein TSAR_005546 [Trichomalopsis sarcophagae]
MTNWKISSNRLEKIQIYFLVNSKYFLFSNFFLYNALFLNFLKFKKKSKTLKFFVPYALFGQL